MKTPLITLVAMLCLSTSAKANIVLSDQFNYPNGPIVGAAGSPWNSHSGTAGSSLVTNGQLRVASALSEDVNALLTGGPYLTTGGVILYSSFTVVFTALPSQTGTYFAHFKDNNTGAATGFGGRIWASTSNALSGFRLGIGNGTSANAASGQIATDLALNTTNTVVTRFDPALGVATIWLNPSAETDPSVTATDVGTVARPNPIDVYAYAFRQSSGEGTSLIDNLRVGTSFADVAGANNPPFITAIPNQHIGANSSTPALPFTIGDAETPAGSLTLASSSSNPLLVTPGGIAFGGADSNRTVTVTPTVGLQGSAIITIDVTDANNATASTAFTVFVGFPTISDIANQTTLSNTPTPAIAFTIGDAETAAGLLMLSATSSNPSVVTANNIVFGGSDSDRTVTLTPEPNVNGLSTITITVSDGINTASDSFVLTVNPLYPLQACDTFDYPNGSIINNSQTWFHQSGATGEVQVLDGKLLLTTSQSEDIFTILTNSLINPADGVILYASFNVNFSQFPGAAGEYFAHYKDLSTGFRCRVFAGTAGAAAGKFRLGVSYGAALVSVQFPLDLSTGVTYTVVTRYNVGTGSSTLWINPSKESDASVTASDSSTPITVDSFSFRESSGIGSLEVDNLKVGTAFHDVIRPTLVIVGADHDVQVCWPANAYGYRLQSNPDLTSNNWGDESEPDLSGDKKINRFFNTTGNNFFRLIKP